MKLQLFCIMNGIPLWNVGYPKIKDDSPAMISGFLFALNSFAKKTSGSPISTMTFNDSLWSVISLSDKDDLFIVSQIDVPTDGEETNYKLKILELLIQEIVHEFNIQFSIEMIRKILPEISAFIPFQTWVENKLEQYQKAITRYELHDKTWIAQFQNADKLIMAIMKQIPIVITSNSGDKIVESTDFLKFHATVEAILGFPILNIENFELEHRNAAEQVKAGKLYIYHRKINSNILPGQFVLIDLENKAVVKGPEANLTAKKVITVFKNSLPAQQLPPDAIISTEFRCELCQQLVTFQIHNKNTYLSCAKHDRFFNKNLMKYNVGHFAENQMHVNSVLVDNTGLFHGIVDAFLYNSQGKNEPHIPILNKLELIGNHGLSLSEHKFIEHMYIINRQNHWLLSIINPTDINLTEMGEILLEKITEMGRIYYVAPEFSMVEIIDKKHYFWFKDPYIIAVCFKSIDPLVIFDLMMKKILTQLIQDKQWIVIQERLIVVLQYLERNPIRENNLPILYNILFEDLLYSPLKITNQKEVNQLFKRLKFETRFKAALTDQLVTKKKRAKDLITQCNLNQLQKMLEFIESIKTQKFVT